MLEWTNTYPNRLRRGKLFDVIESVVNSRPVPEQNRRSTDSRAIDIEAIINHFDGDVDLLATLAAIFADSSAIQLSEIEAALARGDAEALGRAAHSLKRFSFQFPRAPGC